MRPALRRAAFALVALALAPGTLGLGARPRAASPFAAEIERLSEPGGTFDTDNLISNERAYLEVVPALMALGVTGGAYVGVGPDQNFSYIARIRPSVAFIIDVRRDNLLLHLLFKAIFMRAQTRVEYLAMLTGRAPPDDVGRWRSATLADLIKHVDEAQLLPPVTLHSRLHDTIESFGVSLAEADYDTIDRFHREFIKHGLDLQFRSFNRSSQPYYPTLRELLLATDRKDQSWNYLASEDDFRFLRGLQTRHAIIPVVGDVAGPHAMRAIGAAIRSRRETVSAFYVSNVENYLFRDKTFPAYADNLSRLPLNQRSVIIRSIFMGSGQSVSFVQPLEGMVESIARGRYITYGDIVREWHRIYY
jgi:hypothetical protein